jgi:hypothetical protein
MSASLIPSTTDLRARVAELEHELVWTRRLLKLAERAEAERAQPVEKSANEEPTSSSS